MALRAADITLTYTAVPRSGGAFANPPTGDSFRQLKFLEPAVQCAPADPEFFRCFRAIAAAFIQCSHDQADFVVVDIDQILICPFAWREPSGRSAHGQWQIPDGNLISCRQGHAGIDRTL